MRARLRLLSNLARELPYAWHTRAEHGHVPGLCLENGCHVKRERVYSLCFEPCSGASAADLHPRAKVSHCILVWLEVHALYKENAQNQTVHA